jgi:predicted nucleotidyltransferase
VKTIARRGDLVAALRAFAEERPELVALVLYGSAARDELGESSDVDLAIAESRPLSLERRIELADELSRLLGREVDAVGLRAIDGLLLVQVLTKGLVVVNCEPGFLARRIIDMFDYTSDLQPLLRPGIEKKVKAFAHGS